MIYVNPANMVRQDTNAQPYESLIGMLFYLKKSYYSKNWIDVNGPEAAKHLVRAIKGEGVSRRATDRQHNSVSDALLRSASVSLWTSRYEDHRVRDVL